MYEQYRTTCVLKSLIAIRQAYVSSCGVVLLLHKKDRIILKSIHDEKYQCDLSQKLKENHNFQYKKCWDIKEIVYKKQKQSKKSMILLLLDKSLCILKIKDMTKQQKPSIQSQNKTTFFSMNAQIIDLSKNIGQEIEKPQLRIINASQNQILLGIYNVFRCFFISKIQIKNLEPEIIINFIYKKRLVFMLQNPNIDQLFRQFQNELQVKIFNSYLIVYNRVKFTRQFDYKMFVFDVKNQIVNDNHLAPMMNIDLPQNQISNFLKDIVLIGQSNNIEQATAYLFYQLNPSFQIAKIMLKQSNFIIKTCFYPSLIKYDIVKHSIASQMVSKIQSQKKVIKESFLLQGKSQIDGKQYLFLISGPQTAQIINHFELPKDFQHFIRTEQAIYLISSSSIQKLTIYSKQSIYSHFLDKLGQVNSLKMIIQDILL